MSDSVKIPLKLGSGRDDGVLLDDSAVKGGYKVVASEDDRDDLNLGTLTIGTPVYVSDKNKTYRWDGTSWVEEVIDIPDIPDASGFRVVQTAEERNAIEDKYEGLHVYVTDYGLTYVYNEEKGDWVEKTEGSYSIKSSGTSTYRAHKLLDSASLFFNGVQIDSSNDPTPAKDIRNFINNGRIHTIDELNSIPADTLYNGAIACVEYPGYGLRPYSYNDQYWRPIEHLITDNQYKKIKNRNIFDYICEFDLEEIYALSDQSGSSIETGMVAFVRLENLAYIYNDGWIPLHEYNGGESWSQTDSGISRLITADSYESIQDHQKYIGLRVYSFEHNKIYIWAQIIDDNDGPIETWIEQNYDDICTGYNMSGLALSAFNGAVTRIVLYYINGEWIETQYYDDSVAEPWLQIRHDDPIEVYISPADEYDNMPLYALPMYVYKLNYCNDTWTELTLNKWEAQSELNRSIDPWDWDQVTMLSVDDVKYTIVPNVLTIIKTKITYEDYRRITANYGVKIVGDGSIKLITLLEETVPIDSGDSSISPRVSGEVASAYVYTTLDNGVTTITKDCIEDHGHDVKVGDFVVGGTGEMYEITSIYGTAYVLSYMYNITLVHVDDELDTTSTNPIQNNVVAEALEEHSNLLNTTLSKKLVYRAGGLSSIQTLVDNGTSYDDGGSVDFEYGCMYLVNAMGITDSNNVITYLCELIRYTDRGIELKLIIPPDLRVTGGDYGVTNNNYKDDTMDVYYSCSIELGRVNGAIRILSYNFMKLFRSVTSYTSTEEQMDLDFQLFNIYQC